MKHSSADNTGALRVCPSAAVQRWKQVHWGPGSVSWGLPMLEFLATVARSGLHPARWDTRVMLPLFVDAGMITVALFISRYAKGRRAGRQ